jgi:hypothetical protein
MNKTIAIIIILVTLNSSCGLKQDFKYKDISDDWIENFEEKDIESLFGTWTIKEIAKVGGSGATEEGIQGQIGKRLIIKEGEIYFELWEPRKINKPNYEILIRNADEGPDLKGTSFFYGYRLCRQTIFSLIAHGQDETMYFEIIHFEELVCYSDGRLFYLSKD